MSNNSLQVINYCLHKNDTRAAKTHLDPSDYHIFLHKVEFRSVFNMSLNNLNFLKSISFLITNYWLVWDGYF